jgi:hypothetical protein
MFTRKPRLQPGKFAIIGAKRLLQQNLPLPDSCSAAKSLGYSGAASDQQISTVGASIWASQARAE